MELVLIFSSLLIAVLVCLFVKRRIVVECASLLAVAIALVESILVALRVAAHGEYSPHVFFSVDALGALVMLIISIVGCATVGYSIAYLRKETAQNVIGQRRVRQYFILLNLFLMAMFLAITANHPIFAWIAIEATTLATAFLISFYNKPSAMEAAWKYLVINSVGLLLGFFGTLLYFTAMHSLDGNEFVSWQMLLQNAAFLDPLIAKIAFIFVLIGYGTKVGLAPMHTWLPDAHSKAPAPISALLSGVLLNVALVVVLRFKLITDAVVEPSFSQILLIVLGLLSIFIVALIMLTQNNYKRLLAYSSIENMGIMSLGFGFGGLGVVGAIMHMMYHALIKSTLFLSAGTIFLRYHSTKIAKIRGMLTALPVSGALFFIGFLAITGTPPFGIFFSKVLIVTGGMHVHPMMSALALVLMAILFIGFFKQVSAMAFGDVPTEVEVGEKNIWLILPPLALLVLFVVLSFYLPPFLSTLIRSAASHY